MSETNPATVLVVDDERDVADVYALRLRDEYETRVAYGGTEALERIDGEVDVVLLDRRMPDLHGDEVLAEIRRSEYDCGVVMVTAVSPGKELLGMDFDDYLGKPVEMADMVAAIERQLRVKRYDDTVSEYLDIASKLAVLDRELPPSELQNDDELARLWERAADLERELNGTLATLDDITVDTTFQDTDRRPD